MSGKGNRDPNHPWRKKRYKYLTKVARKTKGDLHYSFRVRSATLSPQEKFLTVLEDAIKNGYRTVTIKIGSPSSAQKDGVNGHLHTSRRRIEVTATDNISYEKLEGPC